jgi:hypothetical protein
MVRDQMIKSTEYLGLVRSTLPTETNTKLLQSVLSFAQETLRYYVPNAQRNTEFAKFFDVAFRTLSQTKVCYVLFLNLVEIAVIL